MARAFKPSLPYSVAAELLVPVYSEAKGVPVKTFPEKGKRINCSFKTYGGTESVVNGLYSVIDTAQIETWYAPEITSGCRIRILPTGQTYDIVGTPENIELRNQFCRFKVQAVKGGA